MGSLVSRIVAPVLARMGSRTIVAVGGTLFLLNMLIPDPIPLLDEFLILVGTILLSRLAQSGAARGERPPEASGPGAAKPVGRSSTFR